ncbi:adenylate/guanylate cyclase domain-containing protein [Kineobactrum salinum]|uniref:Adenylate/guanylate cyclase domain-containing protein n=1 Tax=Kineobactrum salinum TaxID=2708301 RepID=A0A6C0U0G4_9GAMM|nr:adenylate/guanylate cyclase domain-containing protein [Kineobactrum salinum]QIB65273.1 adenylate/guanylate cyclase domain-containing protein [Kineobactrum salinum]
MSRDAVTIVFADVSGSTGLFERLGDDAARSAIRRVLSLCGEVVQGHGGRVVKTIGDELMAAFPGVERGVRAALEMQRRLNDETDVPVEQRLGLRIGLHHGPVLLEEGDLFGDAVNTAARIAGLARRDQIVASASSLARLPAELALCSRSLGRVRVAGKQRRIEIVDIVWQEDTSNLTSIQIPEDSSGDSQCRRLTLTFCGRILQLGNGSRVLTLGRDAVADIMVDAEWVSRHHATIEHRRGFFVLTDHSTNGSFVSIDGEALMHLHRAELLLHKRGLISLGQSPDKDADLVLEFHCSQ